jgi:hypothetical protein
MKKELKQIMSLSFPFCKNQNRILAEYFNKINSLAHEAEVHIEKHGENEKNPKSKNGYRNYSCLPCLLYSFRHAYWRFNVVGVARQRPL